MRKNRDQFFRQKCPSFGQDKENHFSNQGQSSKHQDALVVRNARGIEREEVVFSGLRA